MAGLSVRGADRYRPPMTSADPPEKRGLPAFVGRRKIDEPTAGEEPAAGLGE